MFSLDSHDLLRIAIGIVVVFEMALLVWRRPALGVWLLAIASVLNSMEIRIPVNFRTTTVYLLDVVMIVLLVATVLTAMSGRPLQVLVVVFGALVAIGLLRGVGASGLQEAFNEGRLMIYFTVGIVFVATCGGDDLWPTVERAWRLLAAGLVVWAGWFVVRNGLGTYAATGERGLNAPQALLVGQAAVISLASGARRHLFFLGACGLALLATQQRTALAATAVGVLVVSLRAGRLSNARATRLVRVSVLGGVVTVLIALMVGPSGLRESVGTAATSVSTTSGTLGWRIDGWRTLLEENARRPLIDRLIGQPAGQLFGRFQGSGYIAVSPHNMYLSVLLVTGIVGLVLFLALLLRALVRTWSGSIMLHALVWTCIVFSVGYQLGPDQGIVIGAALAAVGTHANRRQRRVVVASPP